MQLKHPRKINRVSVIVDFRVVKLKVNKSVQSAPYLI